jgi:hypothetical protein
MNNITENQIAKIKRLQDNFAYRIKSTLQIKNKEGKSVPFDLNSVQAYIHSECEDQLKRTGRVRKIILKGRKQGCSTYVAARFFDRMMREGGIESFILAHREDTVDTLYDIAKRFHETYPDYKVSGENNLLLRITLVMPLVLLVREKLGVVLLYNNFIYQKLPFTKLVRRFQRVL